MHFYFTPLVLPLPFATLTSLILIALSLQRKRAPGASAFAGMMFVIMGWCLAYTLEVASADQATKVFWYQVKFLFVVAAPLTWLLFACHYSAATKWLNRRVVSALLILPLATAAILLGNSRFHLMFTVLGLRTTGPFTLLTVRYGPWFWVHASYSYLLLLLGTGLFIRALARLPQLYRRQAATILLGVLLPWISNVVTLLEWNPVPDLDLSPFAFTISGILFLGGFLRFQMLDVVPVARDAILERLHDGVIVLDSQERVVDFNSAAQRLLALTADIIGWHIIAVLPLQLEGLEPGPPGTVTHQDFAHNVGGARRDYDLAVSPLHGQDGQHSGYLLVFHDVTASERRYQSLFEHSPDAVVLFDLNGQVRSANPAGEQVFGYTVAQLRQRPFFTLVAIEFARQTLQHFERAVEGEVQHFETMIVRQDNSKVALVATMLPIIDEGRIVGISCLAKDITERQQAAARLEYLAQHDVLTGLANRALLLDRLQHALTQAARRQSGVALLFLDLDRFKVINDSLGHDVGDQLLLAVAGRLKSCIRPSDTLARLGGDEFTILLPETSDVHLAVQLAERILQAFRQPFNIANRTIVANTSIGITLSVGGIETPPADLLRDADIAMYQSKRNGVGGFAVFEASMTTAAMARLELEAAIRQALQSDEFALRYQPTVDLATGRLASVEALVRWRRPGKGLLSPGSFIPIAEETELIFPIGDWVLTEACRQARLWQDLAPDYPLTVWVNLSAREFQSPNLVQDVTALLETTGLEPRRLGLEITEGTAMGNAASTIGTLQQLKKLGVRLAIDDFGTGYSSLSYLKRFPVDVLKIDRAFVSGLGANTEDTAITSAVIVLAHTLGLHVTAEGVENATQVARLRALGCEYGQGYFFAQPLGSSSVSSLLELGSFDISEAVAIQAMEHGREPHPLPPTQVTKKALLPGRR